MAFFRRVASPDFFPRFTDAPSAPKATSLDSQLTSTASNVAQMVSFNPKINFYNTTGKEEISAFSFAPKFINKRRNSKPKWCFGQVILISPFFHSLEFNREDISNT